MTTKESIERYGYALVTSRHDQIFISGEYDVEQICESKQTNFRIYRLKPVNTEFLEAVQKHTSAYPKRTYKERLDIFRANIKYHTKILNHGKT